MTLTFRTPVVCAVLAAVPLAPALAADYDPPIYVEEAPEFVPVEIGSGWYLRGDVAYASKRDFRDTALRLDNSIFDAALVRFDPVVPLDVFSVSQKTNPISGSVGIGYHVNDLLRVEANIGLLYNDKYSASGFLGDRLSYLDPTASFGCLGTRTTNTTTTTTVTNPDNSQTETTDVDVVESAAREGCGVNASVRDSAWNGMVNAYVDLGTVAGFTPYVGAGVGLLYTRTKLSVGARCTPRQSGETTTTTTPVPGTTVTETVSESFLCEGENGATDQPTTYNPVNVRHADYNLLYSLSAGFAYQLTENTKLDVGYQFTDATDLKGMDTHQVKVGLRYDLW